MKPSMKKMLMMAVALVATWTAVGSAFAANPTTANDSWAKIFADRSLIVSTPYSGTFGPMGIFNACATESEFKAISPVDACTQYVYKAPRSSEEYPGEYICVKKEKQLTVMSRTGVQHTCVNTDTREGHYPDCLEYADLAYRLPTKFKIEVMHGIGENYGSEAFTKEFTVPACAQ